MPAVTEEIFSKLDLFCQFRPKKVVLAHQNHQGHCGRAAVSAQDAKDFDLLMEDVLLVFGELVCSHVRSEDIKFSSIVAVDEYNSGLRAFANCVQRFGA